jgi:hypothetical protein
MNIVEVYIADLKKDWGYESEELDDIREKMEELANSCFWQGYNEGRGDIDSMSYKGFSYAKKSDMSDYE